MSEPVHQEGGGRLGSAAQSGVIDVHQHLWPAELIDQLRRRSRPPMLRGWTLYTDFEPPYEVTPVDHDVRARRRLEGGTGRILVSMSTPIGVELLEPDEARPLLDAWHEGVQGYGPPFEAWAAVTEIDPDLDGLQSLLLTDNVIRGLQVSAVALSTPAALEALTPVLRVCELADRPVLVHPGPVTPDARAHAPSWWSAVVAYPAQLQAAWWSWWHIGRSLLPDLRICFAAGAGLAPISHERFNVRAGHKFIVDPGVFVETSSYGRQGIDALTRALGIDAVVLGSDRPYAEPADPCLGDAAWAAISINNPHHLLQGARP